jgi:hypothetical protein
MKRNNMSIRRFVCVVLLGVSAGCIGYLLRGVSEGSASARAATALPQVDDLVVHESFSRIENTKEDLRALCTRLQMEMELRLVEFTRLRAQDGVSAAVPKARLEGIIQDLESEVNEFEGTDQELDLAEDLLRVLKTAERSDLWVKLYLKALYEHPTHRIVDLFADQAIPMGRLAGREDEVVAGLKHLVSIPLNFRAKDKVETILAKTSMRNDFAGADDVGSAARRSN